MTSKTWTWFSWLLLAVMTVACSGQASDGVNGGQPMETVAVGPSATATVTPIPSATPTPTLPPIPPAAQQAVAATMTAMPSPTPLPAEEKMPFVLSAPDLAVEVDIQINEVVKVVSLMSKKIAPLAEGGALSADDEARVYAYLERAQTALVTTQGLIDMYLEIHAVYNDETNVLMGEMGDLVAEMYPLVVTLQYALDQQDMDLFLLAFEKLSNAADRAAEKLIVFLPRMSQTWNERMDYYAGLEPTEVATTIDELIQQLNVFRQAAREALQDNRITQEEMMQVAQANANAQASLRAIAWPRLENVAYWLDETTRWMARGEIEVAHTTFWEFEEAFPTLPIRP